MPLTRFFGLFAAFVVGLGGTAFAATPAPAAAAAAPDRAPVLRARSAILMEARTGTVLFQSRSDDVIPPASLTKLMTLHLALEKIDAGELDLSRVIVPGPAAWARNTPPRSSVMFLGPRQKLTVNQLLKGLVVDSGNDAAVAVAILVAGSVSAFVAQMNQEAVRLGYTSMHFEEPAGISARNSISAREYAEFCRLFINLHPEALKDYFSLREFTYPLPENLQEGNHEAPITQTNRNVLLGHYEGVDGLKTGYIDESGYNIAVTAERGGMRLISVILGVPNVGNISGATLRATQSAALLDYGFQNFTTLQPAYPPPAAVRVWKGRARNVDLIARLTPVVAIRKEQAAAVKTSVQQITDILAPLRAGQVLGNVIVSLNGKEIARFPLEAARAVETGSFVRRAYDSVILFFRSLFGKSVPA
jgi:serine-type D-Ala-D-Ala carboxypeptidase (penicillin-binding protein 5/6)